MGRQTWTATAATWAMAAWLGLAGGVSADPPADLDIPLTVTETAGLARTGEPVSGGVPLPPGLVKDPSQLRLVDEAGVEVLAQFSAINRRGSDQSIMWLLVQTRATIPANGTAKFHLRSGKPTAEPGGKLKVTDGADAITVETGAIKFTVSRKRFNLIDAAWITADGKTEQVIAPGNRGGSSLTLAADGGVYNSLAEPPTQVVVEESGPQRATILVRGLHRPVGGKGKLPYLYGYLVRIRAYAGQPFVRISYALTSGHEPAIGSPVCSESTIRIGLEGPDIIDTGAGTGEDDSVYATDGKVVRHLAARYAKENNAILGANVVFLDLYPWGRKGDFLDICSYKTYEMQLTLLPHDQLAGTSDLFKKFNGYLRFDLDPAWVNSTGAWGDYGGVSVPDAALAEQIKRRFQPYKPTGWRDFGSDPEFESGSSRAPGGGYEPLIKTAPFILGYLQTADRRMFDQLERTAWHWRDRRYIYLDGDWSEKNWQGRSGVYYAYYDKGRKNYPDVQPANYDKYDDSWNYGGRYGPMDTQHFSVDEVVDYYYLTGDRQCLDALNAYGKQAASFVAGFVKAPGAKVGREHGWVTRALVGVYEATNDQRWFDAAQAAVKAIMDHQDKTAGTISPIMTIEKSAYTGKVGPATHVPFMNAAVSMALGRYYRHHPDEEVRDSILGIADWLACDVAVDPPADVLAKDPKAKAGFSYYWASDEWKGWSPSGHRCMSTMAWAYLATGQKRYLEAADKHAGRLAEWYSSGFGQEYVYLKTVPRKDPVAPAGVADLRAEALGGGKVRLTWTAPGDDGDKGQAAEYQVKYAAKQIKERSDWRTRADREISFWAATNCKGEPKPGDAGSAESFTVDRLAPGTHWFALKSYDEQPNQSDLSNVVKVEVK